MATHGDRRATTVTRTAFGTATLRPDPTRPQGWELFMDGVPQSYVDLADPTYLAFEYVRVGQLLIKSGDARGALEPLGRAVEVNERLTSADPGNAELAWILVEARALLGDALAATGSAADAMSRAASSIFGVLKRTAEVHSREILLVDAQDELVNPTELFEPEKI